MLDPKHGYKRQWNLKKLLGSHENAHIAFTLSVQTVMGAFLLLVLGGWLGNDAAVVVYAASAAWLPTLGVMLALMSFGLFRLNMHLGKPLRFYRGFNNWRLSPVSREIAGVSLFFAGLAGLRLLQPVPAAFPFADLLKRRQRPRGGSAGRWAVGGYYMIKLYRIPARPFWNHWHTDAAFVGTAFSLGGLLLALLALVCRRADAELASLLATSVGLRPGAGSSRPAGPCPRPQGRAQRRRGLVLRADHHLRLPLLAAQRPAGISLLLALAWVLGQVNGLAVRPAGADRADQPPFSAGPCSTCW